MTQKKLPSHSLESCASRGSNFTLKDLEFCAETTSFFVQVVSTIRGLLNMLLHQGIPLDLLAGALLITS